MKHLMIDLETWSLQKNAAIISIGAVKFDLDTTVSTANDHFHAAIDPTSYQPYLRWGGVPVFDIDPGTLMWWMSPEYRQPLDAWLSMEHFPIAEVLIGFMIWLNIQNSDEYLVWGKGSDFDNVILLHALEKVSGVRPWSFRSNQCYRTLAAQHPTIEPSTGAFGIAHTALADALWQAAHCQAILREIAELGLK